MLEVLKIEQEQKALKKNASKIKIIFFIIGLIAALIATALHIVILISIISEKNNPFLISQILSLASSGIGAAAAIFSLFTVSRMFSEISCAQTPLNNKLIKRLILIGHFLILVFAIGIISQIVLPETSSSLQLYGLNINYYSSIPNNSLQIKFEYLFGAIFCYSFSYVFKYTIELQQIADETI